MVNTHYIIISKLSLKLSQLFIYYVQPTAPHEQRPVHASPTPLGRRCPVGCVSKRLA